MIMIIYLMGMVGMDIGMGKILRNIMGLFSSFSVINEFVYIMYYVLCIIYYVLCIMNNHNIDDYININIILDGSKLMKKED